MVRVNQLRQHLALMESPLLCPHLQPNPWTTTVVSNTSTKIGQPCPSPPPMPPSPKMGLLALRSSVSLASWSAPGLKGWDVETDPCTWDGVGCTGSDVTLVDLSTYDLQVRNQSLPLLVCCTLLVIQPLALQVAWACDAGFVVSLDRASQYYLFMTMLAV